MSQKKFPPISLEQAKSLTTKWRTYYADLLRAYKNRDPKKKIIIDVTPNDPDIFRGFTIPLFDLSTIVTAAENHNNKDKGAKIDAVRVYLAMGRPDVTDSPGLVHVLLLPVANNKDVPHILIDSQDEDGAPLQSSIYDFTTPCPDMCDTDSQLYKADS